MSRIIIREERCKGCLLCTLVCPVDMLEQSDSPNRQGYKVIKVKNQDMSVCKGCGFCAEICPDEVFTVYRSKKDKTGAKTLEEEHV